MGRENNLEDNANTALGVDLPSRLPVHEYLEVRTRLVKSLVLNQTNVQ